MIERELPLFPLRAVLFPNEQIGLRVFEVRYLDLVRRCLRNDEVFGVIAIRRGSEVGVAEPYAVGTAVRIVDWSATPSGLLGLELRGTHRFRCASFARQPDGLYVGCDATAMPDAGVAVTAERRAWAERLLIGLARPDGGTEASATGIPGSLADANDLCWNLARSLPLGLGERQELLELYDLEARFDWLGSRAAALAAKAGRSA